MNKIEFTSDNVKHILLESPFYNSFAFKFIVNGEKYESNRLIAELLSPIICKNNIIDSTNEEFVINTETKGNFGEILDGIKNFKTISFEDDNDHENKSENESENESKNENKRQFFIEVFVELGNEELLKLILKYQISKENVFEKIVEKKKLNEKNNFLLPYTDEIEFIARNISTLNIDKILELDYEIIEEIISSPNLLLKNEDELINILLKFYKKDQINSNLLEYVCYEYVSCEKMEEFISTIKFEDINERIWNSICFRLKMKIDQTSVNKVINPKNKHNYSQKLTVNNQEEPNAYNSKQVYLFGYKPKK